MSALPLRWIVAGVAALALALAASWLVSSLSHGKRAAVAARVEAGRGGAMADSAADAIETVGARGAAETDSERKVRDAHQAIDTAPDLRGSDAAARDGLCDQSPDYC